MIKRLVVSSMTGVSSHAGRVPNVRGNYTLSRRNATTTKSYGGKGPPAKTTGSSDDAKLVENERWKYLATWLNTMAAGTVVVGLITPVFRVLSEGVEKAPPVDVVSAGGYFSIVLGIAIAFHVGALGALGKLRA